MALTGREKQARFKARKQKLGQSELRGIWLTGEEKALAREFINKLISKRSVQKVSA